MVIVSQITSQDSEFSKAAGERVRGIHRALEGNRRLSHLGRVLFICTCVLWYSFR